MSRCTSQSMTLTTILPNNAQLARINPVRLSSEAKFRLRFIEHYLNTSRNVSETCRLFGIAVVFSTNDTTATTHTIYLA